MPATDQTQCFLDAMSQGEIAAALILADCLQDLEHPAADRIAALAGRLQATESFLEAFMALYEIRDLLIEE